jgi:hypothetical protein
MQRQKKQPCGLGDIEEGKFEKIFNAGFQAGVRKKKRLCDHFTGGGSRIGECLDAA